MMDDLKLIIEGKTVLEEHIGKSTGMYWNINNGLAELNIFIDDDCSKRIKLHGHYDFKLLAVDNLMMFLIKVGDDNWHSAPFSPHLAIDYNPKHFEEGTGMPLSVKKINVNNGLVEELDILGLGNDFSNAIAYISSVIKEQDFDYEEYNKLIQDIYASYPTDDDLANEEGVEYSIDW